MAREKRLRGGVFREFGKHDDVLVGFAQALRFMRACMTDRQLEVVELLRHGQTQTEAAEQLQISKQGVSDHASAAGSETCRLAELGWKAALALATTSGRSRR